jgi:hypothetical protein
MATTSDPWTPASFTGEHDAMKPVDGNSSSPGRNAKGTIKEVGLMEFRFQPDHASR